MSKTVATKAPNPYFDARQEWNERYGDYLAQARNWRALCYGMAAILAVSVAGNVIQGTQSKIRPYVVEVDKLHAVLPIGPADQASKGDVRVVRAQLADFITNLRSVYYDAGAQQVAIRRAYAQLDTMGSGFAVANEYMRANDPFKRAQKENVSVTDITVLPLGGDTWRVEWLETVRDRSGEVTGATPYQAAITVKIVPPDNESAALTNPLGVYVTALSWSSRTQ